MTDTASIEAIPGLEALFADDGAPPAPAAELPHETPSGKGQVSSLDKAATAPVDPLAEELYAEEVLQTPEQAREAAKLLREERAKIAVLKRKALNAHAAVERREQKFKKTANQVLGERAFYQGWREEQEGIRKDRESGDPERFLTAFQKETKSADPLSYWKKVALHMAQGKPMAQEDKREVQADPELKAKVDRMEQHFIQQQERQETAYIEHLKTQNLTFAQKSDETPFVKLYASEQPANIREAIAGIMLEEAQSRGRPIDVKTACGILEASLKAHYELSQRVGGNTDGEKGTAGSGPDAGRESSGQPPKPESAPRAPATVPASLAATQGNARRALSHREQREQQVQSLPPEFFRQFGL